MSRYGAAYLSAAESAAALLADPAVAEAWEEPSALREFRVSGLAGHLAAQVFQVANLLAATVPAPGEVEVLTLMEHYSRVAWIGADIDADVNVGIRESSEKLANDGPAALVAEVNQTVEGLRTVVADLDGDRAVLIPWAGWALRGDDFLITRMMEIAVHSDDLACSVVVPTPELPDEVLEPVLTLLARLAVRRHGPTALLRALSRAERTPATVSAF